MDKELILKTAVHVHSDWSYDGRWSLNRIADLFSKLGYRLILMSEHDATFDDDRWKKYRQACQEASTDQILLVPGIEYSDANNIVHLLVWGSDPFLGKQQPTSDTIQRIKEHGGFCVLAHPSRRQAAQQIDSKWLPLLNGIEMWNRKADGIEPSASAMELLRVNSDAKPFVGLDFHRPNQLFPLSMMLKIKGDVSEEAVYRSLFNGDYMAKALGIRVSHFENMVCSSCVKVAERLRKTIAVPLRYIKNKTQI